jgi:hypothetical protein
MADGRNNSRTIWYIVGAIVVLLLLAWIFGLFGAGDVAEVDGDGVVVSEEGIEEAAEDTGVAVEDAAEATEEAVEDGAEAAGDAVEDAAVATEEAVEEEAAD